MKNKKENKGKEKKRKSGYSMSPMQHFMYRTFGVTRTEPSKENKVIFYTILAILLATLVYILSFYVDMKPPLNSKRERGRIEVPHPQDQVPRIPG